jgi:hypothetical protein
LVDIYNNNTERQLKNSETYKRLSRCCHCLGTPCSVGSDYQVAFYIHQRDDHISQSRPVVCCWLLPTVLMSSHNWSDALAAACQHVADLGDILCSLLFPSASSSPGSFVNLAWGFIPCVGPPNLIS